MRIIPAPSRAEIEPGPGWGLIILFSRYRHNTITGTPTHTAQNTRRRSYLLDFKMSLKSQVYTSSPRGVPGGEGLGARFSKI